MKTIASFAKPEEAHLLRMRLEAVGIAAFVQDEFLIQMDMLYSNAIGGVRVQVADENVQDVRDLLSEDKGVEPESRSVDEPHCPRCSSTALERERYSKRLAWLAIILTLCGFPLLAVMLVIITVAIPALFFQKRTRCTVCLHAWETGDPCEIRPLRSE